MRSLTDLTFFAACILLLFVPGMTQAASCPKTRPCATWW